MNPLGLPEDTVLDRGPQFISRVWLSFFQLLGISISLSSGYHPQTNSQTEHKIQEIGGYLRSYCHQHQHNWIRFLPWTEYAQNSLRQSTTGLTPFQCILSYQPPVSLVRGNIRRPSREPLVPGEREGMTLSTNPFQVRHTKKQEPGRRMTICHSHLPSGTKGLALYQGYSSSSAKLCYVGPFTIERQINQAPLTL